MATVRAKFYCSEIVKTGYSREGKPVTNQGVFYKFAAVYSNDPKHENKSFFTATPNAKLEMFVDNPEATFELGKEYYLDFTPAD